MVIGFAHSSARTASPSTTPPDPLRWSPGLALSNPLVEVGLDTRYSIVDLKATVMNPKGTPNMFRSILLLAVGALTASATFAQNDRQQFANLLSASDVTSRPAAKVDDLAWIAGSWQGEALGGHFEETWNPPSGGTMVGMFKLVKEDGIGFYEICSIVPDGDSLRLRIKHFDANLVGWEDKDKSVEFPLLKLTANEAFFDGLTFRRVNAERMDIFVLIERHGESNEVQFACQRRSDLDSTTNKHAVAGTVLLDGKPQAHLTVQFRDDSTGKSVIGITDENGKFVLGHQTNAPVEIQRIIQMDSVLGKQRDLLAKTESLGTAVAAYVLAIDCLDFGQCPTDFVAAFKRHRDAWQESIEFLRRHDSLRGEMHELFAKIRQIDDANRNELKKHVDAIFGTWNEVEAAAKAAGVTLDAARE